MNLQGMRPKGQADNGLLFIGWNQDQGCFVCGLSNGFRVFNADVLKEKQRRDFDDGGVGHVEMLFRCNYLALVGGGRPPKYPTNKAMIWDDRKKKCVIELPFKSEVIGVRLRRDRIVVVLEARISVFTFTQSPQRLHVFETCDNPKGLCVLCPDAKHSIMVLPGTEIGQVQVVDLADPKKAPCIIAAHETQLACLALNAEGTRLATASEKGTLIRVFDTQTGKKVHEVRRGSHRATVHCLNFSHNSHMLCASSDSCTVHIFNLAAEDKKSDFLPKYFSSQWSFAKYSVSSPCSICAFNAEDTAVISVGSDGEYIKASFTAKGDCSIDQRKNFLAS